MLYDQRGQGYEDSLSPMQFTFTPDQDTPGISDLTRLAYQGFQWGKNYFGIAHKTLSTRILSTFLPAPEQKTQPLSPELLQWLKTAFDQLIETDWQDAQRGIYPVSLLFDHPWLDFVRYYPVIWLDLPQMWQRSRQKQYQDMPVEIDPQHYPRYYLQNFHHQTDGYLSDHSANLYDLQVEILFGGTADAMRRRILAPLQQELQSTPVGNQPLRILDVACGTGRTLKNLRAAFSQAALYGVDLSTAYLRKANQLLSEQPGELPQLLQANGEDLPYLDNYFQGVTSVFLFHELPPQARQRVIEQCFRVLQPGGMFVICDSIQALDSPELQPMMENFATLFHEPYYRHYIQDDLGDRLQQVGFHPITTQRHFMSKYWVARKPL